jgi:dodecin
VNCPWSHAAPLGEQGQVRMSANTYGDNELPGRAAGPVHEAIRNGTGRAAKPVRNLDRFEVTAVRGHSGNSLVRHLQVQMKTGFRIENPA